MEKSLGPEHLYVAATLSSLAALYHAQGRYGEELPLYQRAIAITEKTRGPNHLDLCKPLQGLALLYHQQGPLRRGRKSLPPSHCDP